MIPTTSPMSRFDPNRPDPNQYGKQAYTCSHDVRFRKFASEQEPNATIEYVHDVAEFIARRCGVEVLRLIDDTPEAIAKWQALKAEYDAWLERNANGSNP